MKRWEIVCPDGEVRIAPYRERARAERAVEALRRSKIRSACGGVEHTIREAEVVAARRGGVT